MYFNYPNSIGWFAYWRQIQARLFDISTIAIANILFAGILLIAYLSNKTSKSLYQLTLASAILIGCFQIFALIPGASRSGVTITAALFMGLSLKRLCKIFLFTWYSNYSWSPGFFNKRSFRWWPIN